MYMYVYMYMYMYMYMCMSMNVNMHMNMQMFICICVYAFAVLGFCLDMRHQRFPAYKGDDHCPKTKGQGSLRELTGATQEMSPVCSASARVRCEHGMIAEAVRETSKRAPPKK